MRYLIFTLLLTAFCGEANAQLYNSGVFYVSSGNTVTTGDFTNSSTATYKNDGTVNIGGNISNSQTALPAGAGTTVFNGTVAQTLSGTAPFRCLNVMLNNVAGLTLSDRLAVGDGTGGLLTFTAGKITAGNNTQDVYFYPGSNYTGYDATHHIIGYTTKSGATNFAFPIGNGTVMAEVDLTSLSASGDFQVLYTGGGYGNYTFRSPIVASGVFTREWWDIHPTAGTATAKVSLIWNDARKPLNHTNPSGLVVAHFTAGAWQSEGGTSSNLSGSSTGTVGPSNAIGTFSPFTFGSTATPLPILLSSFTVTNKDCSADLSWTTELEENAAGFDIEQSTDGVSFTTVSYVKANGEPSTYSVTIPQILAQSFYRIRMVDLDGNFVYSQVAELQLNCIPNAESLSVYPNPLTSHAEMVVKFVVPATRGAAQLYIYDMEGKRIHSEVVQVQGGINLYYIPQGALAQGIYTVFVVGDGWKSGAIKVLKNN